MNWLEPSSFNWATSPPLSSFHTAAFSSSAYVFLVLLSTFVSRHFFPVQPSAPHKKNDDLKTQKTSSSSQPNTIKNTPTTTSSKSSSMTGLQWQPWFNSDLKTLQLLHNFLLLSSSAIMLLGVLRASKTRLEAEGGWTWPTFLLCEQKQGESADGELYYWSYLYYLSKYYEFGDTFLQLARGKPPPNFGLHVYHHACVIFMAWAWLETKQSLQFIGLVFNTLVHVIMYTYFFQRTLTSTVPSWKSLVTLLQIVQFVTSMIATCMTLYAVYGEGYECAGMRALGGNVGFNLTLLYSFVKVYGKGSGGGGRKKEKPKMVMV